MEKKFFAIYIIDIITTYKTFIEIQFEARFKRETRFNRL